MNKAIVPNFSGVVKAALALEQVSIQHQVQMDADEALAFANRALPSGLGQLDFVRLIEKINALIPRMDFGPNNLSTGRTFHKFRIGLEYSRVVYVIVPKNYAKDLTPNDWMQVCAKMRSLATKAKANEYKVDIDPASLEFRLWWD